MLRSNTSVSTSRACSRTSKRQRFNLQWHILIVSSLLQELDEDLMLELDEVVRQNQLACLPIAKSGRAEAELVERYPMLLDKMEQSKRIKIDSISLQSRLHEREARFVGGSKAKAAFLEEFDRSPSALKSRPKSPRDRDSQSQSPSIKARESTADLMFEMEEDGEAETERSKKSKPARRRRPSNPANDAISPPPSLPEDDGVWDRREQFASFRGSFRGNDAVAASTSASSYKCQGPGLEELAPSNTKKAWDSPTMVTSKIDMKDIMAQASPYHVSNLSAGLSLRASDAESPSTGTPAKLSQRERKKRQQTQLSQSSQLNAIPSPLLAETQYRDKSSSSPWQIASKGPTISLKHVLGAECSKSPPSQKGNVVRTTSPLTLRQTVSGKIPVAQRATSGPTPTLAPTQKRSISTPHVTKATVGQSTPPTTRSSSTQMPTPIQSIRHNAPPVEPSLQLSMSDILSQQQMAKDVIKEAAAKRSLQEIQEEQAFQEWWDEESRKVKAEEEEVTKPTARGEREARGRVRGRGGSRGRGRGRGRGGSDIGAGSGSKASVGKKAVATGQGGRAQ